VVLFVGHEIEEMFQTRDRMVLIFIIQIKYLDAIKLLLDDVVVFSLIE
jgi:hypothetical protein